MHLITFAGNFSIREKRQAMDMMNKGTELGAQVGALVDGPLGAAVGGAIGFVASGFLCIFICKDEGIIFIWNDQTFGVQITKISSVHYISLILLI